MELKTVLLRLGIAIDDNDDVRVKKIKTYLSEQGHEIDFAQEIDKLTDLEVYYLAAAVPLLDLSRPKFSTDIAEQAREKLQEATVDMMLEHRIVDPKDNVPYFAIYNLKDQDYDFDLEFSDAANIRVLRTCVEDFLLKSGLKRTMHIKKYNALLTDNQIRKSETLLVLYYLKDKKTKFYYWLTNIGTPSYNLLQKYVDKV
ncbi:hypothetical protein [Pedobacter polysacchareus]|uniref:hypothetical protein n=1 Tax=Pedobacter polysacchareus TaxID=2861973 RepID=UPI001C9A002F|nr:hypothetical protein [Pedobacter polysacchareus]